MLGKGKKPDLNTLYVLTDLLAAPLKLSADVFGFSDDGHVVDLTSIAGFTDVTFVKFFTLGSVEIQDSQRAFFVIQAPKGDFHGSQELDGCPMGEDSAALPG